MRNFNTIKVDSKKVVGLFKYANKAPYPFVPHSKKNIVFGLILHATLVLYRACAKQKPRGDEKYFIKGSTFFIKKLLWRSRAPLTKVKSEAEESSLITRKISTCAHFGKTVAPFIDA